MRRAVAIITALFALGSNLWSQTRAEELRAQLLDASDGSVFVAAHRGAWREAPENSLQAIEKAIEMGVEIVEIDVRRTVGGRLILSHDPVIFRPSGAPTLEEALLAARGRVLLNLDKAFRHFDDVVAVAEGTGTLEQIIMKSSRNPRQVMSVLGKYRDKVLFMPIVNLDSAGALARIEEYMRTLDPPMYELTFSREDNPVLPIALALLKGRSRLWYTALWPSLCGGHDDSRPMPEGIGWLIDKAGAGAVQTDIPAQLIEYLKYR